MKSPVSILDVQIHNLDSEEARSVIAGFIDRCDHGRGRAVFFANVHSIHLARKHPGFLQLLREADLVLPDGSGLKLAGRLFGQPIRENLNGTDFTPTLLAEAERRGWSVYLFGGGTQVVGKTREVLQRMYPRLFIVGWSGGFLDPEREAGVVKEIMEKKPDVVLVALGSPRQEEWIMKYGVHLPVGVCLAVGGLFDFIAGRFRRAPQWMRSLGLEWAYRFLQDPKTKWDRVFVEIPQFLMIVFIKAFLPGNPLKGREA